MPAPEMKRPERFVPALRPLRLYAREGEYVFCHRGHFIGYITRDVVYGERLCGDEVSRVFVKPGEHWPVCRTCRAPFVRGGVFRFREGWRS